jgi:hypothetical protein
MQILTFAQFGALIYTILRTQWHKRHETAEKFNKLKNRASSIGGRLRSRSSRGGSDSSGNTEAAATVASGDDGAAPTEDSAGGNDDRSGVELQVMSRNASIQLDDNTRIDRHERLTRLSTETQAEAVGGAGELGAADTQGGGSNRGMSSARRTPFHRSSSTRQNSLNPEGDGDGGGDEDLAYLHNWYNNSRREVGRVGGVESKGKTDAEKVCDLSETKGAAAYGVETTDPVQESDRLGEPSMSAADLRESSKTSRQHALDFATNVFAAADKNGDGTLTKTEIRKYFKANPEDKYVKVNNERPRS